MFAEAKTRTQETERILKESGIETDRKMPNHTFSINKYVFIAPCFIFYPFLDKKY
jgi:hypothetical protein